MKSLGFYARVLAAMLLSTVSLAQAAESGSTWKQIHDSGELRIGVAQCEPWFFKDPATEQWNGIGYNVGKDIAKELGVSPTLVNFMIRDALVHCRKVSGSRVDTFARR